VARIRDVKTDLKTGVFDIPEPVMDLRVPTDPLSADLLIIPGLAFDNELVRLGRGAGYFDRFLKDIKGKKPIWGLAFNCQVYPYTIPREEQDVSPDLVISPYTLIRPKT
jgi:5-formyltetrahydrofolate cyclo-ligase